MYRSYATSLALAMALLTGCQTHTTPTIESASGMYENGSISLAKRDAQLIYERGGPDAQEAAWLIGLCDYRHGRTTAARAAFELAADSSNAPLAARAKAMIGQTLLEDGQPAAAAVQFEHAWPELRGDDRSKCAQHAATAWSQAGRPDLAQQWQSRTREAHTSASQVTANRSSSTGTSSGGSYTLQAGAYKQVDGARRAKEQMTRVGARAGIGPASIRTRTDRHARFVGTERVGVEQVWPPEHLNLESSACSTARVGVGGGKDRR